jgi:hypothetical protein
MAQYHCLLLQYASVADMRFRIWSQTKFVDAVFLLYKIGYVDLFVDVMCNVRHDRLYCLWNTRDDIYRKLSSPQLMELAKKYTTIGNDIMYQAVLTRRMDVIEELYYAGVPLPKVPFKELNVIDSCASRGTVLSPNIDTDQNGGYVGDQSSIRWTREDGTYRPKIVSIFNEERSKFMEFLMRNNMIIYDTDTYGAKTEYYNTRDPNYSMLEPEDGTEFLQYALGAFTQPLDLTIFGDDTDTVRYFAPSDFENGSLTDTNSDQYKHKNKDNIEINQTITTDATGQIQN